MKLTENTLVPVSLVLTICAGIYAFAKVSLATDVNTRDIQSMQEDVMRNLKEQSLLLNDLRAQTAGIDAKLDSLSDRLNRSGRSK